MNFQILSGIEPMQSLSSAGRTNSPGQPGATVPFADLLGQAMRDVASTQEVSAQDAVGLVLGDGADLHTIMINSAMETAAIETAVELTSRVVSAYKEIMQMQI